MAGTITTDLTTVDAADALGTWLVVGTAWAAAPVSSTDVYLQGTAAINANASTTSVQTTRFASVATAANLDLTISERHLFFWMKVFCLPALESRVRGGLGIYISSDATPTLDSTVAIPWDGPTNAKVWFVSGKDFEPTSGWVCYVVNPQGTPDQTLGTPVITTVNRAGIRGAILLGVGGGAVKPKPWIWDKMAYGSSLTINDGTAGTPATFADIYATDSTVTNSFGILTQSSGIYYCAGKLIFGTAAQGAITNFKDTGQVIVFQNFPVATTFYEIKLAGAAGFATTVELGNFSAGLTSGGLTIRGASLVEQRAIAPVIVAGGTGFTANDILTVTGGTFVTAAQIKVITVAAGVITVARMETAGKYSVPPTGTLATTGGTGTGGTFTLTFMGGSIWTLTANAANQTLNLYGCTLSQMKSAALASTTSVRGCSITNSGAVTSNSATIDSCTFQDVATAAPISATYALIINSTAEMALVTNSKFINCNRAIKITAIGTYTFDNLTFSGNAFDIENSSAGLVTINAINGANPVTSTNTGGGSTIINNTKTLKVTVVDKDTAPIETAQVAIFKTSDNTQLMNQDTETVTAGSFVVGVKYTILTVGTTDFTLIGAASNTVGVTFTATGAGTGTGTATNGVASVSNFNYTVDTPIYIRVRKSSPGATKYIAASTTGTITSTGFSATIVLSTDTNA